MKDFAVLREAAGHENLSLHHGLALSGGVLAIAGAALMLMSGLTGGGSGDTVGAMALGWVNPHQVAVALLTLAGALLGGGAGYWLWLLSAQMQVQLGAVPASVALKRAAVPFAAFLPLLTSLVQGRPEVLLPAGVWAVFTLGWWCVALLERGDKRKIYFAHPTEADYHPGALFTHGAVITLGAGAGWYLQSLPQGTMFLAWGLWFPVFAGLAVWFLALGLGGLLGFLYTKHTFNQAFHAVALAALPLALLPLQAAAWVRYAGVDGGGFQLGFLAMVLPILALAAGFVVLILALLNLTHRPVETQPAWEELFRALMLIAAVPLLLLAAAYWPVGGVLGRSSLVGPVDVYREGEPLAGAQAMLLGRLPFKEILFRHGFLSDAVIGLAAMNWFGSGLEGLRLLLAWLAPVGLVALYLLGIFCLPWIWAVLLSLLILTGNLGWVAETRFFFTYIGFIFTLLYLQGGRWPVLLLSALATVLALIASYTAGAIAVAGHLVLLATYFFLGGEDTKNRLLGLGVYLGASLAGIVPWFIYLGLSGSLGAYFQNFGWVLGQVQPVFSAALPGWGQQPDLIRILLFALPPLAICFGAMTLAGALGKAKERGLPWNVLLLTVVTGLLWLRYLQRGQFEFLLEALPVTVMLLAFELYRQTAHNPRLRGAVFTLVALVLFIPRAGALDLPRVAGQFGLKNRVPVEGWVKSDLPALGNVFLPAQQAKDLAELALFLDGQVGTADSFFDFSNQPLLYALVPRRPVVASLSTVMLASFEQQLEAIRNLDGAKIKAVVYPAVPSLAVAGIPSEVRHYAVSEYLLQRFTPTTVKGGCVVLVPREENPVPDAAAAAALQRPAELGALPCAWGSLSKYSASQGGAAGSLAPADGVRSFSPAGLTVTAQGEQLLLAEAAVPVTLRLAAKLDAAQPANVLTLSLTVPPVLDGETAVLAWGEKASGRLVSFRLQGDGAARAYVFRLGALPSWVLAQPVSALQLTLPGGGWTWDGARFLAVNDLPVRAAVHGAAPAKSGPAQAGAAKPAPPAGKK
jgi:hypothetical protein